MARNVKSGTLLVPLTFKLVGAACTVQRKPGAKVRFERNPVALGQFVVWTLDMRHYAKLNAIDLPITVQGA